MKDRKLDIFALLRASDRCDGNWFSRQADEVQKDFKSPVVMRWAASIESDGPRAEYMLCMVNERVNIHLYDLHHHPELVYRLIASCGLGEEAKHKWLPPTGRTTQHDAVSTLLREHYPDANESEIALLLSQFDRAGFKQYVDGCGVQPDDAKGMMNAWDKYRPEEARKGKAKSKA